MQLRPICSTHQEATIMGSVVATEVLQKAQPQIKPPRMINGVRLPKRLWQ